LSWRRILPRPLRLRPLRAPWLAIAAAALFAGTSLLCGCVVAVEPDLPSAVAPITDSTSDAQYYPMAPRVQRATVTRVVDGDTARFLLESGAEEIVRFIGIDTPESTREQEPWGAEASSYTKELLPSGTEVWLEIDVRERDRYDRLLAYVWLERPLDSDEAEVRFKMLNAQLTLVGLATPLTIQPNSRYAGMFAKFTEEARDRQVGMWNPEAMSIFDQQMRSAEPTP